MKPYFYKHDSFICPGNGIYAALRPRYQDFRFAPANTQGWPMIKNTNRNLKSIFHGNLI
jgi:hypothetical protein